MKAKDTERSVELWLSHAVFWVLGRLHLVPVVIWGGYFLFGITVGIDEEHSSGSLAGVVTKFSQKGMVFKSWEGELALSDSRKIQTELIADVFRFSTLDEDLAVQISEALKSGESVSIQYHEWFFHPMTTNTGYIVKSIEKR